MSNIYSPFPKPYRKGSPNLYMHQAQSTCWALTGEYVCHVQHLHGWGQKGLRKRSTREKNGSKLGELPGRDFSGP